MTAPETMTHFTPSRRSRPRSRFGSNGRPGPGKLEPDDLLPGKGSVDGSAAIVSPRGMLRGDPRVGPQPRVGSRQLAARRRRSRRAERRAPRVRSGTTALQAAGEDGEHRYERQDVAVEMGLLRHQREPVDADEREQDEIGPLVPERGRREPDDRDEQERPDRLPEAVEVGNGRDRVVLEPEPALPGEVLHAGDVVPGRAGMDQHERARDGEPRDRERRGSSRAPAIDPTPRRPRAPRRAHPGTSPTRRGRPRARPTRGGPRRRARARM